MSKATLWAASVLMLAAATSWADAFVKAPETNWPYAGAPYNNPWVIPFPYQRNIRYAFDNTSAPLAPHYEGIDDLVLFPSDNVEIRAFQYFDTDPITGSSRRGLYGIDNRQGTGGMVAWIKLHIDNWDRANDCKHVWEEIIYAGTAAVGELTSLPGGFGVVVDNGILTQSLADGWTLRNRAWIIEPNPPWEEITFFASVAPGTWILIDEVHFATECVPEPATLALLAAGAGALAVLRRRQRQQQGRPDRGETGAAR